MWITHKVNISSSCFIQFVTNRSYPKNVNFKTCAPRTLKFHTFCGHISQTQLDIFFKFSGFSIPIVYYQKIEGWKPKQQRLQNLHFRSRLIRQIKYTKIKIFPTFSIQQNECITSASCFIFVFSIWSNLLSIVINRWIQNLSQKWGPPSGVPVPLK